MQNQSMAEYKSKVQNEMTLYRDKMSESRKKELKGGRTDLLSVKINYYGGFEGLQRVY